ncbi:MAG TPA: DUF1223 domain-containing protein, partial [Cyclobacteriaceae bacterium]|nr:DUF1223 domain-containing protein [Cyclobacteriaceae bacterium]
QGCSSCPAADRNLSQLVKEARENSTAVFALSFHVDYWNHLGWKDPYSRKEFTKRQQDYGGIMNLSSIYTPQMIVNGVTEFVGSDLAKARQTVAAALRDEHPLKLQINNVVVADGVVSFDYTHNQDFKDPPFVNVAVVTQNIENFVPNGENKGKTLRHDNVVIAFRTVILKKNDHLSMSVPAGLGHASELILYAQGGQMEILAATSQPLK